jgi:hypothetical protein
LSLDCLRDFTLSLGEATVPQTLTLVGTELFFKEGLDSKGTTLLFLVTLLYKLVLAGGQDSSTKEEEFFNLASLLVFTTVFGFFSSCPLAGNFGPVTVSLLVLMGFSVLGLGWVEDAVCGLRLLIGVLLLVLEVKAVALLLFWEEFDFVINGPADQEPRVDGSGDVLGDAFLKDAGVVAFEGSFLGAT